MQKRTGAFLLFLTTGIFLQLSLSNTLVVLAVGDDQGIQEDDIIKKFFKKKGGGDNGVHERSCVVTQRG